MRRPFGRMTFEIVHKYNLSIQTVCGTVNSTKSKQVLLRIRRLLFTATDRIYENNQSLLIEERFSQIKWKRHESIGAPW